MKLLLTAFEPFGGDEINSSLEVLKAIPDKIGDKEIYKLQVPVVFGKAGETVLNEAKKIGPDAILSLGMAEGQSSVTPEFVGINFRNARIPDNDGNQPVRETIAPAGPAAIFSTLPVFEMAEAIKAAGLKGEVSYSAGSFVCNDLLYTLLLSYSGTDVKIAFMHFPLLPEQAKDGKPWMAPDDMLKALTEAIKAI